jgi:hypothetical protein
VGDIVGQPVFKAILRTFSSKFWLADQSDQVSEHNWFDLRQKPKIIWKKIDKWIRSSALGENEKFDITVYKKYIVLNNHLIGLF